MQPALGSIIPNRLLRVYHDKSTSNAEEFSSALFPIALNGGKILPEAIYKNRAFNPNPRKPNISGKYIGKGCMGLSDLYEYGVSRDRFISIITELIPDLRNRVNVVFEKIAYDLYWLIAQKTFIVPNSYLTVLHWVNKYTLLHDLFLDKILFNNRLHTNIKEIQKGVHIMSEFMDDYTDLKNAYTELDGEKVRFNYYLNQTGRPPEMIYFENRLIKLTGLMSILAAGKLLLDIDVLGDCANNIGYKVVTINGEKIAKTIKINPVLSFNTSSDNLFLNKIMQYKKAIKPSRYTKPSQSNLKDIQYGKNKHIIKWDNLTQAQQIEFIETVKRGSQFLTDNKILDFMIYRKGQFNCLSSLFHINSPYAKGLINLLKENCIYVCCTYDVIDNEEKDNNLPIPIMIRFSLEEEMIRLDNKLEKWVNQRKTIFGFNLSYRNIAKERIVNCFKFGLLKLDLSNLWLDDFPDDLEECLLHVKEIDLSNNYLTCLPNYVFELQNLKYLNLNNNPIINPRKVYEENKRLNIQIQINYGKLENLKSVLFNTIADITCEYELTLLRQELYLRIYRCKNLALNKLDLSGLGLKLIPEGVFEFLTEVEYLNLEHNKLEKLPLDIGKMVKLKSLNCGENQLTEIPFSVCELKKLNTLIFNNNQISELPENIGELTELSVLCLSNNKLSKLPVGISNLSKISLLDLSKNQLCDIEGIYGLHNLIRLSLADNRLNVLNDIITDFKKLTFLSLAGNLLSYLPPQIDELTNLQILDLSHNKFTSIPESVCSLIKLIELDFSHNKLDTLSSKITQLPKLKVLNLANNQIQTLPDEIRNFKQLETLNLSCNNLIKLSYRINELHYLKDLDLTNNRLTELSQKSFGWYNLSSLSISGNPIKKIPLSIAFLAQLQTLYLTLSEEQLHLLPDSLLKRSYVEHVIKDKISNQVNSPQTVREVGFKDNNEHRFSRTYVKPACRYRLKSILGLPEEFRFLLNRWVKEEQIEETESISRKLAEERFINAIKIIPQNSDFDNNFIDKKTFKQGYKKYKTWHLDLANLGLTSLPEGIFRFFTHLKSVDLSNNRFNDFNKLYHNVSVLRCEPKFGAIDKKNYFERKINFWASEINCSLSEKESRITAVSRIIRCYRDHEPKLNLSELKLTSLPTNLSNYLPHLCEIDLRGNLFEEVDIPVSIKINLTRQERLKFLTRILSKWSNEFKCSILEHEKREIAKKLILDCFVKEKKELDLSNLNPLANIPGQIFVFFPWLKKLDLMNNQFCSIPEEIGLLVNLEELILCHNLLTSLPKSINKLSGLSKLNLVSNNFSEFPEEVLELRSLKILNLGDNHLQGLPNSISKLVELEALGCNNNLLQKIPDELCKLAKLQLLSLNENELTALPSDIGNLTNLYCLRLSKNQITSLPVSITNLTNIAVLDVDNNKLFTLPPEIEKLEKLEYLNFSSNWLTKIPPGITKLRRLENFDISNNLIQELPDNLNKLPRLKKLNLDNNPITSTI